jgi:hypothetical protein
LWKFSELISPNAGSKGAKAAVFHNFAIAMHRSTSGMERTPFNDALEAIALYQIPFSL